MTTPYEKWQTSALRRKPFKIERNHKRVMGTSLKGYVLLTRAQLECMFGPSLGSFGDKTYDQWVITDGALVVTIYDYKEFERLPLNEKYQWHIGGNSRMALQLIEKIFPTAVVESGGC